MEKKKKGVESAEAKIQGWGRKSKDRTFGEGHVVWKTPNE